MTCGCAVETPSSVWSPVVGELVAIGAAIASNCEPCLKYHVDLATKLGAGQEDIAQAVAMAKAVKETPARKILELAQRLTGVDGDEIARLAAASTCSRSEESGGRG